MAEREAQVGRVSRSKIKLSKKIGMVKAGWAAVQNEAGGSGRVIIPLSSVYVDRK